jgi:hypothetical protein
MRDWPYTYWMLPMSVLVAAVVAALAFASAALYVDDDPCVAWHGTWLYYENGLAVCVDPNGRVIQ